VGRVEYELVEVRSLGSGAVPAIGRWRMWREVPGEGWFTIVVERRPEGPWIVDDHSATIDG
jgi:hypothetical protein